MALIIIQLLVTMPAKLAGRFPGTAKGHSTAFSSHSDKTTARSTPASATYYSSSLTARGGLARMASLEQEWFQAKTKCGALLCIILEEQFQGLAGGFTAINRHVTQPRSLPNI
ncbi:hypothetical protein IQ06DRAFT_107751 [Phaeosphaeriaceae sp. SRC1lsM3a]|nr:hypothetical protein IQ06DRAFT_107751 [Stagonospora sp. SRC1lsM3a]